MRIRTKIALAGDMLRALFRRRSGGDPSRILIIRLDGFGDFSLYLPFASVLRECYPRDRYHLTLLANAAWCDTARMLSDFDEYVPLEVGRYMSDISYRGAMNTLIGSGAYGTVLQPRFFREPFLEDRLALAAGAARGTAFATTSGHVSHIFGNWLETILYDRLVGTDESAHEADKNRSFFSVIAVS